MANPIAMAITQANKRVRNSARCAVRGIGVSTMDVMLLDGRLQPFQIGKALAQFLRHGFVALRVLLALERRQILTDGILKLLTGTAQLPVGTSNQSGHLRQALWPKYKQRQDHYQHKFRQANAEHTIPQSKR